MGPVDLKVSFKSYSGTSLLVFLFFTLIIYLSSFYSFLLFHSLAEMISVIIAGCIFVLVWDSKNYNKNYFLLFIGISMIAIGFIDTVHLLSYKGMNIFTGFDSNLPTQLWVASRFLQAISLILALLFLNRKFKPDLVLASYMAIIVLLFLSILYWQNFPDAYIEGEGLTTFKKASEYIICLIFIIFWFIIFKKRKYLGKNVFPWFSVFIFSSIIADLTFTFYIDVYDISNLIGHIFKTFSLYALYVAIVQNTILFPFYEVFENLNAKSKELESINRKLLNSEKTLEKNINSLSQMNRYMIGRELKMVELKKEIINLKNNKNNN